MASIPTAEESARKIICIYVNNFNLQAGGVLLVNNFLNFFSENNWKISDFNAGLKYSITNEWLEFKTKDSYALTYKGFLEAGGEILSDEKMAKIIINFMVSKKCRANEGCQNQVINLLQTQYNANDLTKGLFYAHNKKWLEFRNNNKTFHILTAEGFKEAD